MSLSYQLNEINQLIDVATRIVESDADWDVKYDLMFRLGVGQKIRDLGVRFDWCDPDASYEEDVIAYHRALLAFRQRCGSLMSGPSPEEKCR